MHIWKNAYNANELFWYSLPHILQSTPETYIQNIRRWLLPFLARCDKWNPGIAKCLLREYVVSTAKDDLGLPLKILQVRSSFP